MSIYKKIVLIIALILIIITLFFVIISASFLTYRFLISSKPINNIPVELINTKREALEFAKKDADFITEVKEIKSYEFIIEYQASFYEKTGEWNVSVFAKYAKDVGYGITFTPDGKITNKFPWVI